MADPWYPAPSEYYVPAETEHEYPVRQGDLVGPVLVDGQHTPLVQVVHPTCELGKASVGRVQVCAVEPLSNLSDDFQRGCVVLGMREKDGQRVIAFAHTFFLPAIAPYDGGMFTNFRRLHLVDQAEVSQSSRRAAMTHDCRLYFIRRWLYFRFRVLLSLETVRQIEAERISGDAAFQGPLPSWVL